MNRTSGPRLFAVFAVVVASACSSSPTSSGQSAAVDHVVATPSTATVLVGDSTRLIARGITSTGAVAPDTLVSWSVDSATIATVSSAGWVTGVGVGTAVVTATLGGKSATVTISVVLLPAARIAIHPASASIELGAAVVLSDTVYDGSGHVLDRTVTWTSSDPDIATVSPMGEVVGLATGQVVITAARENVLGTATVAVVPAAVASIVLDRHVDTLVPPQAVQIGDTLYDARGAVLTGRTVTWATRDPFVAEVNDTGLVTAVGTGTTWVVATSEGERDSLQVVIQPPPPDGLELEITNHLVYPISVSVNGSAKGFAGPGSVLALVSDSIADLRISWTLKTPLDRTGQPVGEVVFDTLPPVTHAGGVLKFDVTSELTDGHRIFTPYLSNTSGATLQLDIPIVNGALPCGCSLADDGSVHDQFGYWFLAPNSTVDAYARNDSGHTGPKISAAVLAAAVDPVTGIWQYTFTVGP